MEVTTVTIKKMPLYLHRTVKRLQLDKEEFESWVTLEELYIELLERGLQSLQKELKDKRENSQR